MLNARAFKQIKKFWTEETGGKGERGGRSGGKASTSFASKEHSVSNHNITNGKLVQQTCILLSKVLPWLGFRTLAAFGFLITGKFERTCDRESAEIFPRQLVLQLLAFALCALSPPSAF